MASRIARFAICADGTAAEVILVPAVEHKCVYRFRRAFGIKPKSTRILRISLPRAAREAAMNQCRPEGAL